MYNIKTFNSSKWSITQSISLHDTSYAHGVSVAKNKENASYFMASFAKTNHLFN